MPIENRIPTSPAKIAMTLEFAPFKYLPRIYLSK
jgi:hypothetical protein